MTVINKSRLLLAGALVALTGAALAVAVPADAATHHASAKPVTSGSYYLALGDSVGFGYREPQNSPTPDYTKASNFVGFPELIGRELGLKVANASCPGETSASFVKAGAQSNGCEANSAGVKQAGYRTNFPLHEKYTGTQLAYALKFLKAHPGTRLVTLQIGANDGFICQESTNDKCLSEIPALEKKIEKNVKKIVSAIRTTAGYQGQFIIVNYYSTDYSNAQQSLGSLAINNALATGAGRSNGKNPYHVHLTGVYKAFKQAAAQTAGNDCTAGLLTILNGADTPCGVHPSVAGQNLIAGTVIRAIKK